MDALRLLARWLIPDWRLVLRKAWSVKFNALSGFFSIAELLVSLFESSFPRGVFSALAIASIIGGTVSRVLAQKELTRRD